MTITRSIALSAGLFIFSVAQAHATAFCISSPYGNTINDGKSYYVLMPSISQTAQIPFDIASRPVGIVFGRLGISPYIINKKFAQSGNAGMMCERYQSFGWYGVGTFHQKYRAFESSIPGVGLRINYKGMPVPTNPDRTIANYFRIQEMSDAIIMVELVKIGPISQGGPLKGVFLQLKFDDVVAAQYQFDREATAPTGPFCTAGLGGGGPDTTTVAHSFVRPAAADGKRQETIAKAPSCLADELPSIKPALRNSSVAQLSLSHH